MYSLMLFIVLYSIYIEHKYNIERSFILFYNMKSMFNIRLMIYAVYIIKFNNSLK